MTSPDRVARYSAKPPFITGAWLSSRQPGDSSKSIPRDDQKSLAPRNLAHRMILPKYQIDPVTEREFELKV